MAVVGTHFTFPLLVVYCLNSNSTRLPKSIPRLAPQTQRHPGSIRWSGSIRWIRGSMAGVAGLRTGGLSAEFARRHLRPGVPLGHSLPLHSAPRGMRLARGPWRMFRPFVIAFFFFYGGRVRGKGSLAWASGLGVVLLLLFFFFAP